MTAFPPETADLAAEPPLRSERGRTGADLAGAQRTGADLAGAQRTGADRSGAQRTGADLAGVQLAAQALPDREQHPSARRSAAKVGGQARAAIRACRPRQWVKNLLVLAAPGAAGVLGHPAVAEKAAIAFGCFCALASATYLLNDVHDREEDAKHPTRRSRPIASGELSVRNAVLLAAALSLGGLGAALAVNVAFAGVAAGYLALTGCYSLSLRKIPVADIAAVSAGFVIRAIAGGVAAEVSVSRWFVIVASFGALFIVAGKRYAELRSETRGSPRPSLQAYSEGYLRFVMILAASVATAAYCLWAFQGRRHDGIYWYEATVVPFVLWLLRYGLLIDQGGGDAPEELVLGDRFLMTMSAIWVGVFACGVYVAT